MTQSNQQLHNDVNPIGRSLLSLGMNKLGRTSNMGDAFYFPYLEKFFVVLSTSFFCIMGRASWKNIENLTETMDMG